MTTLHEQNTGHFEAGRTRQGGGTLQAERPQAAATVPDLPRHTNPQPREENRTPAAESERTPAPADAERVRARELDELRKEFNGRARGAWGIMFDPFKSRWIAVRGKNTIVHAPTARELRDRIISGSRRTSPVAA